MIKVTDAVKHLIIINVLFFVAALVFKEKAYDLLAIHYPANPLYKPWQIITHMFMHGNITHLLLNMIGLWMFGSIIEQTIGRNNFLILYFISGLGSTLFSIGIDYFQYKSIYDELLGSGMAISEIKRIVETPLPFGKIYTNETYQSIYNIFQKSAVGASGALYGVLIAYGVLFPKAKMGLIFFPVMIESRIFIPLLLLSDMFFGVFSINDGIGHFAHVGGAIAGFLVIWYMKKKYT